MLISGSPSRSPFPFGTPVRTVVIVIIVAVLTALLTHGGYSPSAALSLIAMVTATLEPARQLTAASRKRR
ncbi:hypothetical protein [Streptomyces sp. TLI_146]|uniref:hypothetical protein n=1 Tax=Streptomyces sp. TLI_146 TaxID=1938858 RepID=UPI000C6FFE65|nr:hypothetical protein [Streptomyces sp. TLI_146]PKV83309.1 hypothetical protein BX283_0809 [Streptomyces sp. TLI_146]